MNNKPIALNVLQAEQRKISHPYKSEHNKTREKKVTLLIIKGHYLFVKNLNSLLKKEYACSKHFCINCLKNSELNKN